MSHYENLTYKRNPNNDNNQNNKPRWSPPNSEQNNPNNKPRWSLPNSENHDSRWSGHGNSWGPTNGSKFNNNWPEWPPKKTKEKTIDKADNNRKRAALPDKKDNPTSHKNNHQNKKRTLERDTLNDESESTSTSFSKISDTDTGTGGRKMLFLCYISSLTMNYLLLITSMLFLTTM